MDICQVYARNPEVRSCGFRLDSGTRFAGCQIGANSKLRNVILDNGCIVPAGTTIGYDVKSDAAVYHVTEGGTVVINRRMLGQSIKYNPEL